MSGMNTCKKILKMLPDSFSLFQIRYIIKADVGMDERTIEKYIHNMLELKMIEEETVGRFRKLL